MDVPSMCTIVKGKTTKDSVGSEDADLEALHYAEYNITKEESPRMQ